MPGVGGGVGCISSGGEVDHGELSGGARREEQEQRAPDVWHPPSRSYHPMGCQFQASCDAEPRARHSASSTAAACCKLQSLVPFFDTDKWRRAATVVL